MNTPVVDFVRRYAQQRTTRMHMPGHKGRGPLGCEELDITEIAGADELYEAEGIIAQSEANATQLFGTAHTYYSTEGSSQCIRAMLHLALQMRPAKAGRPVLLAARNAHKALLYAAALLDFDIQWLWSAPEASGALCSCPVTPEALRKALEAQANALPRTKPRRAGWIYGEWLQACRGGEAASCDFGFAQYITEFVQLGNLALQTQKPVEFDPAAMKVTNGNDAADRLLHSHYENGWTL